jgi:membrane fusion protein, heavy metal efflux system
MKQSFIKHPASLKWNFLIRLVLGTLIIVSCNNEPNHHNKPTVQPGPPPSLSSNDGKTIISLSGKEIAELKIQTDVARSDTERLTVSATATVSVAPGNAQIISAPIQGKVKKIFFTEGDFVSAGDVLFHVESIGFGNLIADFIQANAAKIFEKSQLARIEQLVEKRIASQNDLDKAKNDFQRANAEVMAAMAKLQTIGLSPAEIDNYANTKNLDPVLKIKSPINGQIDHLNLEPGQAVDAYEFMARIINTSKLLITAYISPAEGVFVRNGDRMKFSIQGLNQREASAAIHAVNPGLDQPTRSVLAHALLENQKGFFKPGENIQVIIETQTENKVITIPISAITYNGDFPMVFVKISDADFERRNIVISELRNDRAFVSEGLAQGEPIAINQIFSLKALMRFDLFSE